MSVSRKWTRVLGLVIYAGLIATRIWAAQVSMSIEGISIDDSEEKVRHLDGFKFSPYTQLVPHGLRAKCFGNFGKSCTVNFSDGRIASIIGRKAALGGETVLAGMTETECKDLLGSPDDEAYSEFVSPASPREKGLAYFGNNCVLIVELKFREGPELRDPWFVEGFVLSRPSRWDFHKRDSLNVQGP